MACAIVIVLVGLGVALGYLIWGRQTDTIAEGYANQQNLDDGSVVLSREPDGKPILPAPAAVPGHKVIRTIEATVLGGKPVRISDRKSAGADYPPQSDPKAPDSLRSQNAANPPSDGQIATVNECLTVADFTCPPVTVRVDLLRAKDGTMRAQVSSSTGEVLDGVDIPREPTLVPKRLPWAIGVQRDLNGVNGLYFTRDIGRLEVGASVTQDATAQARIGWRF